MDSWDKISSELIDEWRKENRHKTVKKDYIHSGVKWVLTLTKDTENDTYKAQASVEFATHTEIIDPHDGTHTGPSGCGVKTLRRGESLDKNPCDWLIPYVEAWIDSRLSAMDLLADTTDSGVIGGALNPQKLDAITDEQLPPVEQLLTAMRKDKMRPQTNATPEQEAEMRRQAEALVDAFGAIGIASLIHKNSLPMAGESITKTASIVRGWRSRGRIPAVAAHHLCGVRSVRSRGFTREKLRPDVGYWYIDDTAE